MVSVNYFVTISARMALARKNLEELFSRPLRQFCVKCVRVRSLEALWNPKYGCRNTVTTCFALIALVAWQYLFDSTLRKLCVHPKYG